MTPDDVVNLLLVAGFCGVERDGGVVYARTAPQSPEFRAEAAEAGWRLVLPWNVRPPEAAMADWNARMGPARMGVIAGEAALVMSWGDLAGDLAHWAGLAAEAEAHFIRWRRARRPAEGM